MSANENYIGPVDTPEVCTYWALRNYLEDIYDAGYADDSEPVQRISAACDRYASHVFAGPYGCECC